MPEARFSLDGTVLYGLLVLDDSEATRVVSAFEAIAADPLAAAHDSTRTSRGRTIHVHRIRGFEIAYTFHEPSNRVWVIDLYPTNA